MRGFIVGALAGGIAMYLWRDQIRGYVEDNTRGLRERTADTLKQAGERMGSMSEKINDTISAGEEAIRPSPVRPVSGNR
ncbi:MAG TPA: YtxH domain-containing protein [Methylomirabilota bacterium]|nr:YtxH domain-containing protein [Methylomirabilota bacterium]